MTDSHIQILNEARNLLDKGGLDSNDRREILSLLDILLAAIEKVDAEHEHGEISASLASSLVSSQALLSLLKQRTAELDTLRKLSLNLTSSLDMSTVLNAVVREAMGIVQSSFNAHIFLYNNGTLEFGAALQADGSATQVSEPRPAGLTYSVARSGQIMFVEEMQTHPLFASIYESISDEERFGSLIGIPLKMENRVVGVMNLARTVTGSFSEAETRLLNLLADQAAVAISNASLHQTISRKAYTDTTTGLPNRRALDDRLDREISNSRRTGQSFAVVMMDLDGFKLVNDTYGHDVGDQVLRLFFNYMSQAIRASDFLARYGGDELTLLMSQTSVESSLLVTDKLVEKINNFNFTHTGGARIRLGISGGIAVYPIHARNSADLLRAADTALYRAKRHERGKFVLALATTGPLPPLMSDTE